MNKHGPPNSRRSFSGIKTTLTAWPPNSNDGNQIDNNNDGNNNDATGTTAIAKRE